MPRRPATEYTCAKRGRVGLTRLQGTLLVGAFQLVGYFGWGLVGALVAIVPGVVCVVVANALRGVRAWNACEKDYFRLMYSGLSEEEALLAVSESFRPDLSESFHQRVLARFEGLDAIVTFHTGPLLNEDDQCEERCAQILEHTTMTGASTGRPKATTDWSRVDPRSRRA